MSAAESTGPSKGPWWRAPLTLGCDSWHLELSPGGAGMDKSGRFKFNATLSQRCPWRGQCAEPGLAP